MSRGSRRRRLLVLTHRSLELGGGGATRWAFLRTALPDHGCDVAVHSAPVGVGTQEFSPEVSAARTVRARRAVMHGVGAVTGPGLRRLAGIEPEALAPSAAWAVTGRRGLRAALDRERPDLVVATGPPVAALALAAGTLTVPWIAEFRDLWAGSSYYDAGGRSLRRVQDRILRDARRIVCVTAEARARLAALHPALAERLVVVANGFDPALLELRGRATGTPGDVELVHAGALYGGRSLAGLADALRAPDLQHVRTVLIGPGVVEGLERFRTGVDVLSPVARSAAVARVAAADVALVVFTPGDDTAVPGKLYEALALGRPILALAGPDSAMRPLLHRLGQGAGVAGSDDPAAIAAALRGLLTAPPAPVDVAELAEFDRARLAQTYAGVLDEAAG